MGAVWLFDIVVLPMGLQIPLDPSVLSLSYFSHKGQQLLSIGWVLKSASDSFSCLLGFQRAVMIGPLCERSIASVTVSGIGVSP